MKKVLFVSLFLALFIWTVSAYAQTPTVRSSNIVLIDGENYYLHTVRKGETLYALSKVYGVSVENIGKENPSIPESGLKEGQVLRIPCSKTPENRYSRRKTDRLFVRHTVAKGETTYSIAKRYAVSVTTLIEDNPGIDPSSLSIGQELKVRRTEIGESSPSRIESEINDYAEVLNKVSDEYRYHVVVMGETIFSLSRMFGVSEETIRKYNDLSQGLKVGAMVRIPSTGKVRGGAGPGSEERGFGEEGFAFEDRDRKGVSEFVYRDGLKVALLLPLTDGGEVKDSFVDFYMGALLAAEELKRQGYSVTIDLYDTQRNPEVVRRTVGSREFEGTNLIIGPVYEEATPPAVAYARRNRIPMVSPLGVLKQDYGSVCYQLAPAAETKSEGLEALLDDSGEIFLVSSGRSDEEFEREVLSVIGHRPYRRLNYTKETPMEVLDSLMSGRNSKIFVVLSNEEADTELVLANLSSVQNNRVARSLSCGPVRVVGSSRWSRYRNIEKNLFFKLNVSFVTNYHADRGNEAVNAFDRRYIEAFEDIPSLYSYRGYDALKLFASALLTRGGDFTDQLNENTLPLLQVSYRFERDARTGNWKNTKWPCVTYRSDYTIQVR